VAVVRARVKYDTGAQQKKVVAMNNGKYLRGRWSLLALVFLLSWSGAAHAQRAEKKRTVVDYFMLLPQKFLGEPLSLAQRRAWVRDSAVDGNVVDLKNDYLHVGEYGRSVQAAVFRHKGRAVFAVSDREVSGDMSPPAVDKRAFRLLRFEGGRWKDVTRALMPVRVDLRKIYTLPRVGTTIKVESATSDAIYYSLVWSGGKFKLRR
jgi:hypothetical protein